MTTCNYQIHTHTHTHTHTYIRTGYGDRSDGTDPPQPAQCHHWHQRQTDPLSDGGMWRGQDPLPSAGRLLWQCAHPWTQRGCGEGQGPSAGACWQTCKCVECVCYNHMHVHVYAPLIRFWPSTPLNCAASLSTIVSWLDEEGLTYDRYTRHIGTNFCLVDGSSILWSVP